MDTETRQLAAILLEVINELARYAGAANVSKWRKQIETLDIDAVSPDNIDAVRDAPVLIGMSADIHGQHIALKQFLRERLYAHDHVRSVMQQAHQRIVSLFDAYFHDPARMPDQHREIAVQMEIRHAEAGRARAVADYIAGMTDRYAIAACEGIIAWGQ